MNPSSTTEETTGTGDKRMVASRVVPVARWTLPWSTTASVSASRRVTAADMRLLRGVLSAVGNPPIKVVLWDGVSCVNPTQAPIATVKFHDRTGLFWLLADAEAHFGDLYAAGRVEVEGDFVGFLEAVYRGVRRVHQSKVLRRLLSTPARVRQASTVSAAQENIFHHYDIGNDFYRLWLDREEMQYTCAYYPDPDFSLERAQVAKLHHVCRKLQLRPGMSVVEAGCGWGGLARFMVRHYGVRVMAYNISREQLAFAREEAARTGLENQVEYVEDDYRNIDGEYDAFVSVGMLEHVGKSQYRDLGEVIERCLSPVGRGLIHSIGRIQPGPMNSWIERRIFPGAYPPSLGEMMEIFEPSRLAISDVENLRLHYAKTLSDWLERYEAHVEEVEALYGDAFVRAWRLYLVGSIAAFNTGQLQLYQVVFTHMGNNQLPWSRAYQYAQSA